jgi:hypothetical protein
MIEVENFPVFILTDDKGNDFFEKIKWKMRIARDVGLWIINDGLGIMYRPIY